MRNRTKLLAALMVLVATGAAFGQFREAARPEIRGIVKSVDAGSITLTGSSREGAADKTYPLAKDVELAIGSFGGRAGLYKEAKLADLQAGANVVLGMSADQKTVDNILAEGPTVRGQLKAVDAEKKTVTLAMQLQRDPAADEKTFTLAPDAEIAADDGRGRRFSIKEVAITDLAQGALVTAWLSIDGKHVQAVLAEGPSLFGTIKATDAGKRSLTLVTTPGRGGEGGEERTLTVANNALVVMDDGKGRRLSLKEAKLENVQGGSAAVLKLSVDQSVVMSVRIEGPTLTGLLKAVDPAKNILVLAIPKGRGEQEEKNLTVAKDARILIDGTEAPLANLKVGDGGPFVQVRLSLDQSTVQFIMARTQPR